MKDESIFQKARKFQEIANPKCQKTPKEFNMCEKMFVNRFVLEELGEFMEAKTLVDQTDALGDLIYFVLSRAANNGINLEYILEWIHVANMLKFPDGKVITENGKVKKPEGWTGPEHAIINELNDQIKYGSF